MDTDQGRLVESRRGFPEACRGYSAGSPGPVAIARLRGCADAQLSGTICSVVYDYDENYVSSGINAASQEVLSTCKPFGVIVM